MLKSKRLIFRPHQLTDLDAFCAMEQDAEMRRYVGGHPRTREAAEQRFMKGLGQPAADQMRMWATVLKDGGTYIGRCGVFPHFNDEGKAVPGEGALGLYIARAYWNQGYATEAGGAFVNFAFNQLQLNRLITTVQVGNNASVHVINKLGFLLDRVEEGPARSFYHFVLDKK